MLLLILLGTREFFEVELLYHIVTLFFIFGGIAIPFLFYIPSSSADEFQFLHILTNTCYCLLTLWILSNESYMYLL